MTRRLEGRLVALGVTGSIAAYKAVELLRLLTAEGADVVVLLSPSAQRFIGPLSFAALSRHPVETDVLDLLPDGRIGHIVVAESADAIVVAPATAHWLGAMANGLAGDVVTAAALATSAPVVVAPAMDGDMWTPPRDGRRTSPGCATSSATPSSRRSPGPWPRASRAWAGSPTCRRSSTRWSRRSPSGRSAQPNARRARPPSTGRRARPTWSAGTSSITAGGTREPIDPVRFIGNRSSGRMGVALAEAALARGARVTLIAAAVEVPLPRAARHRSGRVAPRELRDALGAAMRPRIGPKPTRWSWPPPSPISGRCAHRRSQDRAGDGLTLELEPTPDLLAEVAVRAPRARDAGEPGAGARRVRRRDGLARAGGGKAAIARASTCSSPTTSRRPAPGSGPRRTASRSSIAGGRMRCRCSPSARSRIACSTASRASVGRPRCGGADCRHARSRIGARSFDVSATEHDVRRLTVTDIGRMYADGERIPMLTAYDYPTARILDDAGIPMILVGDSLGQVAARLRVDGTGHDGRDAPPHAAVVRGTRRALVDRRHAVPVVRDDRRGDRERGPVPAGRRARRRSRSRAGSERAGGRGTRQVRRTGHGPHRLDAAVAARPGRQGQGPGQDARCCPRAAVRRRRDPGGRRVLDRARARAGAAGRGDHVAPAHPDDRDRSRRHTAAARSR